MADETGLVELTALFQAEKSVAFIPAWRDQETPAGRRLHVACPLWIGESLISGLRLDIHGPQATPQDRPFFGLTAVLFATHRGKTYHLGRIEFDPVSPVGPHHRNPMTARSLSPTITGPHIHSFEDNAALGLSALSPTRDLPIARSLDKPYVTFAEILTSISENFNIPGLWLEEPGWSRTLL